MLPGPILVYKCSNCENLISKGSLRSGNTFGATIYSDGKMHAPNNPEFPSIIKCSKCKAIFWLNDENFIGHEVLPGSENIMEEYEGIEIERSKFLTLKEYAEALKVKAFKTVHEEIYIRQRIWWGFNHRKQKGTSFFKSKSEELFWLANINRLLELFDPTDVYQRIFIAELNRHLGNFDACMKIIDSLDDDSQWLRYKNYYSEDCKNKNTKVFVLHSLMPPR